MSTKNMTKEEISRRNKRMEHKKFTWKESYKRKLKRRRHGVGKHRV